MNKTLSSNAHKQRTLLSNLCPTNCRTSSKSFFHHWMARHLQKQPWSLQVVWWSAWSTVPEQWPEDHCTLSSCKPHECQVSQQCIMPKQNMQNSVTNNKIEYNNCSRNINPYPTAFPYGNSMVLHFYQQQESSTTKTVHKVINRGLKTYV